MKFYEPKRYETLDEEVANARGYAPSGDGYAPLGGDYLAKVLADATRPRISGETMYRTNSD